MRRIAVAVFILLTSVLAASAKCDVSEDNLQALKKAEAEFRATPSRKTGEVFLNELPEEFCRFYLMFGWINDAPASLYNLPLEQSLPSLANYVPAPVLAEKFVKLASHAKWELDNINQLQSVYSTLFYENPDLVIFEISILPNKEAETAVRFLFDGISPENSFLDDEEKQTFCQLSERFCNLINLAEKQLTKQTKPE